MRHALDWVVTALRDCRVDWVREAILLEGCRFPNIYVEKRLD